VNANLVMGNHLNLADGCGAVPNRSLVGCHRGLNICGRDVLHAP